MMSQLGKPLVLVLLLLGLLGCAASATTATPATLRLATTTSTADSGLLDAILPDFEQQYHATVEVVAVGTGQALALGAAGDADVLLVHARAKEDAFVAAGDGSARHDVMFNDFVLVGPPNDPAGIAPATSAAGALARIAASGSPFASRGDESGTNSKELALWEEADITPAPDAGWYRSLGQGMGETLIAASEMGAYTLTDRGTWLSMRDELPDLTLLFGGESIAQNPDPSLRNPYGVIRVSADKHPGVNAALAEQFVTWLLSEKTQKQIGEFGKERFGQPLFYPNAAP